jgi:cobalt-zinc-cadmium efflux system outer membrane protein
MQLKKCLTFFFLLFITKAQAQITRDTLYVDLPKAEQLFLHNNIQLLAQKLSIDSARANIITAKLYDNPEFDVNTGFYNLNSKKFFDLSTENAEVSLQLSQLIKTAGKRNKNIAVTRTGAKMTEYAFFDLVRTLKYTLRNDFYNIYFQEQTAKVYDKEINSLKDIVTAYKEQVTKGNIAPKDLLRLQSQLYSLQAEQANMLNDIDDLQSEFKLLLRASPTAYVVAAYNTAQLDPKILDKYSYKTLVDSASLNRYDLQQANLSVTMSKQNLALQKALAVPDLTLNAGYDRLGSYVKDYNSVGVGIPLAIFNRNQGNIKQAKIGIQSSEAQLDGMQDQVESQVANAYIGALRATQLLQSFDPKFEQDFNHLIEEVNKNFEKRNLNILEFLDFYDAYKQNVLQLNTLRFSSISQLEQLNYTTGTQIFNP